MTSGTTYADSGSDAAIEARNTTSVIAYAPTIALIAQLLAAQTSLGFSLPPDQNVASTIQVATASAQADILRELINFHERLANSQQDLPADAARILRENLWQLYG